MIKKIFSFLWDKYRSLISNFKFQAFITLFCVSLISFFLVKNQKQLISTDPYPNISYYTPQKRAEFKTDPVIVKTGFFIEGFSEFDINNNTFVIDGIVWFEFNPRKISLKTIEKFSFERGTIQNKSEGYSTLQGDNLVVKYTVRVSLSTNLDHKLFPLNDHTLFIVLINEFVSPDEVMFTTVESSFGIADNIYSEGWKLTNKKVDYGYVASQLDRLDKTKEVSNPIVIFSVNLERPGLRHVFLIIVPIFIFFYLCLVVLVYAKLESLFTLVGLDASYITSLFLYRFVIEDVAPNVHYYMVTDYLYMFALVSMIIIFLFDLFLAVNTSKNKKFSFPDTIIRENLFVWLQIAAVIVTYYIVRWNPY